MLVMKFGGTSVQDADAIERVGGIVRSRMRRRPVVVVSAFHGVTDQLLTLGQTAASGDGESALAQWGGLRQRHYDTAQELLGEERFRGMRLKLDPQFELLEQFARGIAAIRELSARSTDYLLSFGELMSSQIVASALSARGLPALWLDSREYILTNGDYTQATPHYSDTYDRMRAGIRPLLINQQLPVLAGFIFATRDGIPTTPGRGGSDFSTALVAAGIHTPSIESFDDGPVIVSAGSLPAPRQLPRSAGDGALRRESSPSSRLGAGDGQKYPSSGSQLPQSQESWNPHHGTASARTLCFHRHRGQEKHQHSHTDCPA